MQGGPRGIGDGDAGAVQFAADARADHPYRAVDGRRENRGPRETSDRRCAARRRTAPASTEWVRRHRLSDKPGR
jgi:hypothetical protein